MIVVIQAVNLVNKASKHNGLIAHVLKNVNAKIKS
jgi:hypothetical protein